MTDFCCRLSEKYTVALEILKKDLINHSLNLAEQVHSWRILNLIANLVCWNHTKCTTDFWGRFLWSQFIPLEIQSFSYCSIQSQHALVNWMWSQPAVTERLLFCSYNAWIACAGWVSHNRRENYFQTCQIACHLAAERQGDRQSFSWCLLLVKEGLCYTFPFPKRNV